MSLGSSSAPSFQSISAYARFPVPNTTLIFSSPARHLQICSYVSRSTPLDYGGAVPRKARRASHCALVTRCVHRKPAGVVFVAAAAVAAAGARTATADARPRTREVVGPGEPAQDLICRPERTSKRMCSATHTARTAGGTACPESADQAGWAGDQTSNILFRGRYAAGGCCARRVAHPSAVARQPPRRRRRAPTARRHRRARAHAQLARPCLPAGGLVLSCFQLHRRAGDWRRSGEVPGQTIYERRQ